MAIIENPVGPAERPKICRKQSSSLRQQPPAAYANIAAVTTSGTATHNLPFIQPIRSTSPLGSNFQTTIDAEISGASQSRLSKSACFGSSSTSIPSKFKTLISSEVYSGNQ